MGLAMVGIVSNYRVLLAAAICGAGAVADALLDRQDLYIVAASVLAAFLALSWAWASNVRARRAEDEPSETSR